MDKSNHSAHNTEQLPPQKTNKQTKPKRSTERERKRERGKEKEREREGGRERSRWAGIWGWDRGEETERSPKAHTLEHAVITQVSPFSPLQSHKER